MKFKQIILGTFTVILSTGLLFGCGTTKDGNKATSHEKSSKHEEKSSKKEQKKK